MRYLIMLLVVSTTLTASQALCADTVWKIFEIKGKASLTSDAGSRPLTNEKNLLETMRKGNRIKVEGTGKVVVVSLKTRQAYEIGDNSEGVIEDEQVKAVKGNVTVKKGYSLPKASDGRMGGIVMRGAGNTRSCLKALSPSNTAVADITPELRWENNCDGLKQVTITVLADEKVVHSAECGETSYRIPAGAVQAGGRYMWLIDGGANFDMASGIFSVLNDPDRTEVLDRMAAYGKEGSDDIAAMLAYIYFLDGKGLNELSRQESEKVRQRFPGAEGLKDLP